MSQLRTDLFGSAVRCPATPRVTLAAENERGAAATGERPRILIVEDDYFVALLSEDTLIRDGFDVVGIALNAREAIALTEKATPDLVVMDIRLAHGDDGIDTAIDLLRRCNIRSIFVTAHSDLGTRSRAEAARPLGWLAKPFSPPALVRAVRDALAAKDGENRPV